MLFFQINNLINAFAITLFPLNYFFQYLYYTDIGSTYFCLLAYYYNLKSKHYLTCLFSLIAIIYRQTNIIWLIFYLFLYFIDEIDKFIVKKSKKQQNSKNQISSLLQLAIQKNGYVNEKLLNFNFYLKFIKQDLILTFKNIFEIINLATLIPYVLIVFLFALFIYVNNGIVVGDRSNHEASINLCQLFYYSVFTFGFIFFTFICNLNLIGQLKQAIFNKYTIFVLIIINIVINRFTYEHKFLLSDNRHYTFYIWSKIYKRNQYMKHLLSPFYYICIVFLYRLLYLNRKSFGWIVAYTLCVCCCLIPQKLLEFRYFIIPFIIFRLNLKTNFSVKYLFIEIFIYIFINSFTIYMFLYKTFYWPSNSEVQRFMW